MRHRWVVAIVLASVAALCACKGKDDDEDPREHRRKRTSAEAVGSGGGGVTLSCPFGLCGGVGGGNGPERICRKMSEIVAKEPKAGGPPTPSAKELEQCVEQMEKMKIDQPKQYDVMEKCMETATDMNSLVSCMTKMYLDGGVP